MRSQSPTAVHNYGGKDADQQLRSQGTLNPDHQPQGLQIGCTKIKGESLQIPVTVNGIPTQAVVDTGAQTTVISEELYQSFLGGDPTSLHQTYLLNAGVGDDMKAKHGLNATFKIGSKTINWEVHIAPIRNSVLLRLDLMKSHDVVIHTRGKVFIGDKLVPSKIVRGDGLEYCVARVTLGETTTIPPTSECVVWGKVEDPRPGVPAVLEPLNITEAVASGSVATIMEKQVPVRLCNFSTTKAALPKGACLEAYPEEPLSSPEQSAVQSVEKEAEGAPPLVVGRVATICDLPEHLRDLFGATSETLVRSSNNVLSSCC